MPGKPISITRKEATRDTVPPMVNALDGPGSNVSSAQPDTAFASDEVVRLAAEKIFRLHARLFEELAK